VLQVIDEMPEEIIERFFLEVSARGSTAECNRPRSGQPTSSGALSADCYVSHAMLGRLARWRKDRIGGRVWYLDCELAEGYAELAPAPKPKALLRLGIVAKGTATTY
jgi:hypothetical protein